MNDTKKYTPPRLEPVCCAQCGRRIDMRRGTIVLTSGRVVDHALRHDPQVTMCDWQCVAEYAKARLQ